ncbi:uncharacterized protein LOC132746054 [Ruditapes philippinarum]|uniref:uncharacterized protein LOC132746054 n=1 Tax=Ruditapes philippinarum TaxID=129788 RepID=UPI00295A81D3|nr:uncharacterized protein LOC132746054 [Ruditapes philippinarum]
MELSETKNRIFKLVIIGHSGVGKTCILQRFCRDRFSEEHIETTAVNFSMKHTEEAGQKIQLYIWDTCDNECHRDFIDFHCKPAAGFILVYDITNEKTFIGMDKRIKHLKEIAQDKDPSFLIVGNKLDAENREVRKEKAEQFAAENGADFIEVSAKASTGINEAFDMIVRNITLKKDSWTLADDNSTEKQNEKLQTWFGWLLSEKEEKEKSTEQNAQATNTWLGWLSLQLTMSSSTVSDTVPEELMKDPFTLQLYRLALTEGKELDRSIRVNIVGNYGQGKTTLMRRILNKDIKNVKSTNAIEVEHLTCQRTREGKLSYSKYDDKDCSKLVKRLASVARYLKDKASLFESTEENNDNEIEEDRQDNEMTFDRNGEHKIQSSSETPLKSSLIKSLEIPDAIDKSYKMSHEICSEGSNDDSLGRRSFLSYEDKIRFAQELTKEHSEEADDTMDISVEFWDFGGQFIFYATHMIFHSRKAIYLLVLDLTSHLNEIAVDQDFPTESHERSMAYFVRFWINSIHSFVGSEDGVEPTIILVGTHKDKLKGNVDQKIETFFENIRKLFDGTKLLKHIYRKDFAVDNTVTDDEGVTALREAIIEIGREKAKTVEIPAKWILLEKSLKEKVHKKIITFQSVMTIDALNEYPLGSNDQVKIFLQYHHSKGTFIYFDEDPISYYVVLDPKYLIDAFKCLITSEQFCKKDPDIRPSFNKLHDEGRLEKELVDKLWSKDTELMYMENKEILLAFLAKHHIISEATKYEEDTKKSSGLGWFVVPSLLRDLYPSDEFEQLLYGRIQSALRFVMEFENSTIIPTIYHRLVAAIVGKWPIIYFRDKPVMYKNLCAARLENNHIGFAEMRSETIELSVANLCPKVAIDGDRCDRLRRFVEAVIEHEFHKLKCSNETCAKLYAIKFRCNHEIHGVNGSKNTIERKHVGTAKQIPCPDFESHASITADGFSQWYIDHRMKLQIPKKEVTEKLLSQISNQIGHNWQTLGHELGVTQVQIEQIIEENPHRTSMKIFAMLTKWSLNAEIATFDVLVESMQKCPHLNVDWGEIRNILDSLE